MIIKSFVGGHSLRIFADCVYDASIRKYRGGRQIAEIPYSGRMLSAKIAQTSSADLKFEGGSIPTNTPQIFEDVDELPEEENCDYFVVSALYANACRALERDTSRLLCVDPLSMVADEDGNVIGTMRLNRN